MTGSIGEILQVNETFGYLDGIYGILNEHQLAFGEGTCPGRLIAAPRSEGGEALFDITMLSRIAMQRCKTAREAILLMGQLAETHGYYGDYWATPIADDAAGETLTIADLEEAWVFPIHPDDIQKTVIVTPFGLFEFVRMAFGLKNAA